MFPRCHLLLVLLCAAGTALANDAEWTETVDEEGLDTGFNCSDFVNETSFDVYGWMFPDLQVE